MAEEEKLTVVLPAYLVKRIKYQADRHGLTGSKMISNLCVIGLSAIESNSSLDYLDYLARKKAKEKKKGG